MRPSRRLRATIIGEESNLETVKLGNTGLEVSAMGLGCGGHSRLGLSYGKTDAEAAAVVRRAADLGVTLIDTAEMYGTETAVGLGIAGLPREKLTLCTKAAVDWQGRRGTAAELEERLNASLRRLGTDSVDVYQLHGVSVDEYAYCREELVPAMLRLREQGKIRYLGITEAFIGDPGHAMLSQAVRDGCWSVMMVGFNLLNPSARSRVLEQTREKGIGTLDMFAVRRALSRPEALRELVADLVAQGQVDADGLEIDDPLGWLVREGHAASIPEAAYRFCRHEPGIDVVLSGTGNAEHLEQNARSINAGPLSPEAVARLGRLFGRVDSVTGN